MIACTLLSLPLLACAGACPAPPYALEARDALCSAIRASMDQVDLDATWSISLELGETARRAFGQDVQRGSVRVVARGDRLWASVHWGALGPMPESRREVLVRGEMLPALTRVASSGESTTSIAEHADLGSVSEDLPILAQWLRRIPSVPLPTLPQAIRAFPPDAIEVQPDGRLAVRVLALGGAASGFDSALVLATEPDLRLESIRSLPTTPMQPLDDDPITNGGEAHVTAWTRVGAMHIPARLERTNYAWFPHQAQQDAQRTIYELTSSGPASAAPERIVNLMEWLNPHAAVTDDRVGASARIGDDTLSLAGARHRLMRPLAPDDVLGTALLSSLCVGDDVDSARDAQATPSGWTGPASTTTADWTMLGWIAIGLGVPLSIGSALWSVRSTTAPHAGGTAP